MPAAAQDPLPTEAAIRTSLSQGEWYSSAQAIDRLVESRLGAGAQLHPDPVLDRLIGELFAFYSPGIARVLLQRAVADPSTADQSHYALLLAAVDETLGDQGSAETIYRRLLADAPGTSARNPASIGLARLLLIGRPRDALEVLRALIGSETDPAQRWEAELLAARAARMLGQAEPAAEYLEQASRDAWNAPAVDAAIARVALDRAVVAGRQGNRTTLTALAEVTANGTDAAVVRQFRSLLPECGLGGVTRDDFAILEVVARRNGHPRLGVIQASRPEIVPAFLALAQRTPLEMQSGQATAILLRCVAEPRAGVSRTWDSPILEWAASRGAYPLVESYDGSLEGTAKLAEREQHLGADSPFLIPILAELLAWSGTPNEMSTTEIERMLGYARRLNNLLTAEHAPADAQFPAAAAVVSLTALSVQQPRRTTERAIRTMIESSAANPATTADALLAIADSIPADLDAAKDLEISLVGEALNRMRTSNTADPRLRGVATRLIRLQRRAGNEPAAAALLRQYTIPPDLCAVAETPPRYSGSDIRAEDYPTDAIWADLNGYLSVDVTVTAHGAAEDIRLVLASPPLVFDQAMLARAPTIHFEPAEVHGTARACRGLTQTISWQLP